MDMRFIWECSCGHIEHGDAMPDDCSKCLRVGEFNRVPDDMIEEKEAGEVLSIDPEEGGGEENEYFK